MQALGNGLHDADQHEDALTVREADLSMRRRLGASERTMLDVQHNLASTYEMLGRHEQALSMRRDVYSGCLKLNGEEDPATFRAANNYAVTLASLQRFEEAKSLLRKVIPVARRVVGESNELTLVLRKVYARALYEDPGATLDDLREAVETIEDTGRIVRRVLGGEHPLAMWIEGDFQKARAALAARDGDVSSVCEAMEAMTSA